MHLVISGNMRETGWSPICCGRCCLKRVFPSTRGPERTNLWCISCSARSTAE